MAGFMGKIKKSNDTALRKKKFAEGTLRYHLFRQAQETLKSGINLKEVVKRQAERNCRWPFKEENVDLIEVAQ